MISNNKREFSSKDESEFSRRANNFILRRNHIRVLLERLLLASFPTCTPWKIFLRISHTCRKITEAEERFFFYKLVAEIDVFGVF